MPKAVRRLRGGGPDDVTGLIHGEDRGMSTLSLDIKNSTVFTGSDRPAEVMLTLNQLIIELAAEQRHTARRQRLSRRRLPGAVYRWGRPPPRSRRGARHERRNRPLQRTTRDPLVCCCSSRTLASVPVWRFREYRHLRQDKLHGGRRGGKSRRPQAKPGVPSVSEETWRAARDQFTCRDPAGRTILARGFDPGAGPAVGLDRTEVATASGMAKIEDAAAISCHTGEGRSPWSS